MQWGPLQPGLQGHCRTEGDRDKAQKGLRREEAKGDRGKRGAGMDGSTLYTVHLESTQYTANCMLDAAYIIHYTIQHIVHCILYIDDAASTILVATLSQQHARDWARYASG